jgi:hypothetical protein
MKSLIKIGTVLAVASLIVTGAFAQAKKPMAKHAPKKAAAMACPICKMPVSMTKTAKNPVAVYVKGKTLYCCSQCKMPASMTTKPMAKKPMAKKKK